MSNLLLLGAGITTAVALRFAIPSGPAVTLYLPGQTRYVPLNILAFWGMLLLTLGVGLTMALRKV